MGTVKLFLKKKQIDVHISHRYYFTGGDYSQLFIVAICINEFSYFTVLLWQKLVTKTKMYMFYHNVICRAKFLRNL